MEKKLEVTAIENGTVIDHIPADKMFSIINILELEKQSDNTMTFGTNFPSKRLGKKAIIKLAGRYPADSEINKIAIVAPEACVNTIKNFKVVDKRVVKVPDSIEGFVKCANPKCITNNERVETKFRVVSKDGKISMICRYCEKSTKLSEAVIIK